MAMLQDALEKFVDTNGAAFAGVKDSNSVGGQ